MGFLLLIFRTNRSLPHFRRPGGLDPVISVTCDLPHHFFLKQYAQLQTHRGWRAHCELLIWYTPRSVCPSVSCKSDLVSFAVVPSDTSAWERSLFFKCWPLAAHLWSRLCRKWKSTEVHKSSTKLNLPTSVAVSRIVSVCTQKCEISQTISFVQSNWTDYSGTRSFSWVVAWINAKARWRCIKIRRVVFQSCV